MIALNSTIATAIKVGVTCAVTSLAYMQPYRPMIFVGRSMEPTYTNHSLVFTLPVREDQLKRGQVVVIDMDSGPIVKRIAFGPGDKMVQTRLEGHWVDLIYARPTRKPSVARARFRQVVVPHDMVYVLGDNQAVSYDSRQLGYISTSRIHRILVDQRPFDLFPNLPRAASG